jgi:hypothetical protein
MAHRGDRSKSTNPTAGQADASLLATEQDHAS